MDRASVWMHGIEEVFSKDNFEVRVNAEEFTLENDYKFRLVCGSCNSPVTFVSKKNGQKYFKHPRRTAEEITIQKENELTCERRINNVKPAQIIKYNQIIEQTTLGEITENFQRIFGNLNKWDNSFTDSIIVKSENKFVVDTLTKIESCRLDVAKIRETEKQLYEGAIKFNKKTLDEKFKFSVELHRELHRGNNTNNDQLQEAYLSYRLFAENLLVESLGDQYSLWEKDPESFPEDKNIRDIFPIIIKQKLKMLPKLYGMLMHDNSRDMRFFVIWCELQMCYAYNMENDLSFPYYYKLPDEDPSKFKFYVSFYLYASFAIKDIPEEDLEMANKQIKLAHLEIERLCKTLGNGLESMRYWVAEALSRFTMTEFYAALEKTKNDNLELEKGNRGYIYIATNKSLRKRGIDEEIKIGKTKNKPKRLAQYKFASSDGFDYEMHWEVKNRHTAEREVHRSLNKFRIKNNEGGNEWFKLSVKEGIDKINKIILEFQNKNGYFNDKYSAGKGF